MEIIMKIGFFNEYLLQNVKGKIGLVFAIATAILTFCEVNQTVKYSILIISGVISFVIYLVSLIFANSMSFTTFKMGDSEISIQRGDIFSTKIYNNHEYIKVFAFNEYFDTQVDDDIISKRSLNGQFVLKNNIDVQVLNERIHGDIRLNEQHKISEDISRRVGNKIKYSLGSVFIYSDTLYSEILISINFILKLSESPKKGVKNFNATSGFLFSRIRITSANNLLLVSSFNKPWASSITMKSK